MTQLSCCRTKSWSDIDILERRGIQAIQYEQIEKVKKCVVCLFAYGLELMCICREMISSFFWTMTMEGDNVTLCRIRYIVELWLEVRQRGIGGGRRFGIGRAKPQRSGDGSSQRGPGRSPGKGSGERSPPEAEEFLK